MDAQDGEPNANDTADAFWQKVSANLQNGKLRLLFVADEIPTELQRVVEFLNEQLFALWSNGYIEIYFYWLANKPPFDSLPQREALLDKLNAIDGVNVDKAKLGGRPSVNLSVFSHAANLSQLLDVMSWVVQEIRAI